MGKTYKIFAAIHSEARSGDVWTYEKFIQRPRLIKISRPKSNIYIIVTYRHIDENFESIYNPEETNPEETNKQETNKDGSINKKNLNKKLKRYRLTPNALVIDSYYKTKLFLENQTEVELCVVPVKSYQFCYHIKYLWQHPNDSIRLATYLSVVSIVISLLPISYFHELIRDFFKFLISCLCRCFNS
ncbi:hypothetical protein [Emticicia sp. 17c]|uniref:hypothetical protein n=1 Tax=Emticicia sp. 17c TaxID=3127704 RepID=UPI00301DF4EF